MSGVSERRWAGTGLPVNGLEPPDWLSDRKGLGEARMASWDLLREGTGGGSWAEPPEEGWREERGTEFRESDAVKAEWEGAGAWRREQLRVRDWVLSQQVEGRRPELRGSKGSSFICASLWNPFTPLTCAQEKKTTTDISKPHTAQKISPTMIYITSD